MADSNRQTTLADVLRLSESDPFLLVGPPAPDVGWVYRDFRAMPQAIWLELLDLFGDENIKVVAANPRQLPPAAMCRAQIWVSPRGIEAAHAYLRSAAS